METAEAKLRNQLSPLYGLASAVLRIDDHPEMKRIVFDMANQAIKNKEAIDLLLVEIEASKISSNAVLSNSLPNRGCEYCGMTDGIHKADCSFMAKL